jgi:FkbM family methyltransferase
MENQEPSSVPTTQLVQVAGSEFLVTYDHYTDYWRNLEKLQWEPETILSIVKFVKPNWVFYDVGSWMGPTALCAASLGAKVFCFEPDPLAFERLSRNVSFNPMLADRIELHNVAVGLTDGQLTLFVDALGNSETSIFQTRERRLGTVEASDTIQAKMINFRDFYQKHSDETRPQFIKFDIEGAEFELVPKVMDLLERNPHTVIHLSTHTCNVAEKTLRRKFKEELLRPFLGFKWWRWDGHSLRSVNALHQFEDELANPDRVGEHLFTNFDP